MGDIEGIIGKEPDLTSMNGDIRFDEGYKRSLLADRMRGFGT